MPALLDPRLADPQLLALAGKLAAHRKAQRRACSPRWPQGDPAEEPLRLQLEWDLAAFATTLFPHIFTDEFNQLHRDYYARFRARQGSRGHRDVTAAPRESSKTTGCASLAILHACAYQYDDFILYLTYRSDIAENKVRDIRDELTNNELFHRLYGNPVGPLWNQSEWTTAQGITVMAAGRSTQVRGITKGFQRFSKVIIDDVESEQHVISADQRAKDQVWLHQTIMRLGHTQTNYDYFGTVLHPQSLLATTLANPGWERHFYQSVQRFAAPESVPLWQEWRAIFLDLSNPQHAQDADAFFAAHQEAMLAETQVLWPARKSYYDLMKIRLIDGETSFWCELQNEPMGDARYLFNLETAAFCDVVPSGIIRAGGTHVPWRDVVEVAGYVDPTPPKKEVAGSDYSCCVIVARDKWEYCYVLEVFLAQVPTPTEQITAIVDMLWYWQVPRLGIESNSFAGLLVPDMREAIAAKAAEQGQRWQVDLLPIQNMRSKVLRISSLEPMLANGWLQLAKTLPPAAYQQLREFLPVDGGGHDDFPDALEGAVRVVKGLFQKRDIV